MHVPITCKYKNGSKTTKKRLKHHFPHYKSMEVFLDVQRQITQSMFSDLAEIQTPRYNAFPRYLQVLNEFDK